MAVKRKATKSRPVSDAKAERILDDYRRRPALFTKDMMFELDAAIASDNFGVTRRMALVLLTESGEFLMKHIAEDLEFAIAAASTSEEITRYANALRDLLGWLEEVQRRVAVSLATREDMSEVIKQAKHEQACAGGAAHGSGVVQ